MCEIVSLGEPSAAFGWKKNGKNVYGITINNSFIAITILNVTTQDTGTYTCTATGLQSYHNDTIQLQVTSVTNTGTQLDLSIVHT